MPNGEREADRREASAWVSGVLASEAAREPARTDHAMGRPTGVTIRGPERDDSDRRRSGRRTIAGTALSAGPEETFGNLCHNAFYTP